MYYEMVTLPKFLLQEKQKKEKIDRVALEGIQNQINTLQARLEVFEPTVQQGEYCDDYV